MLRLFITAVSILFISLPASASDLDQDLRDAIDNGQLEKVVQLLDQGADINSPDAYGFTPLIWAVSGSNIEIFKYILKKGADVNFVNKDGGSALYYAVTNQKIAQLELLLKKGASPNVTFLDDSTPLSYAKARDWGEFPKIVKILEKAGAK